MFSVVLFLYSRLECIHEVSYMDKVVLFLRIMKIREAHRKGKKRIREYFNLVKYIIYVNVVSFQN